MENFIQDLNARLQYNPRCVYSGTIIGNVIGYKSGKYLFDAGNGIPFYVETKDLLIYLKPMSDLLLMDIKNKNKLKYEELLHIIYGGKSEFNRQVDFVIPKEGDKNTIFFECQEKDDKTFILAYDSKRQSFAQMENGEVLAVPDQLKLFEYLNKNMFNYRNLSDEYVYVGIFNKK